MMTMMLRVVLIVVSVITMTFMMRKIRQAKVQIEDAVQRGLEEALGIQIKVLDYTEHALASGSGAQAASYIHLVDQSTGKATYGVGISSNITRASIRGIFSAVNRLFY